MIARHGNEPKFDSTAATLGFETHRAPGARVLTMIGPNESIEVDE